MNASPSLPRIEAVDLSDARQARALLELLDEYASSDIGGNEPLSDRVKETLIESLRQQAHFRAWLAYDADQPVALLNAFVGFSTFDGLPLLNVHDLAVTASHQGRGIGRVLLQHAVDWSKERGFGRVTLEVRSDNERAKRLYHRLGFHSHTPEGVTMEFLKCSFLTDKH